MSGIEAEGRDVGGRELCYCQTEDIDLMFMVGCDWDM